MRRGYVRRGRESSGDLPRLMLRRVLVRGFSGELARFPVPIRPDPRNRLNYHRFRDAAKSRGRKTAGGSVAGCRPAWRVLAPQVSLRCLNAHMTEQELDLFKLPASFMTQAGACAAQIVRGNIPQATLRTSRGTNPVRSSLRLSYCASGHRQVALVANRFSSWRDCTLYSCIFWPPTNPPPRDA
jgi:hypothetical protein